MKRRGLLLMVFHTAAAVVFEFGYNDQHNSVITTISGRMSLWEKSARIALHVPVCEKITYVRVEIYNPITTPHASYNKDTHVVHITYKLLQNSLSRYEILAKGIRRPECGGHGPPKNSHPSSHHHHGHANFNQYQNYPQYNLNNRTDRLQYPDYTHNHGPAYYNNYPDYHNNYYPDYYGNNAQYPDYYDNYKENNPRGNSNDYGGKLGGVKNPGGKQQGGNQPGGNYPESNHHGDNNFGGNQPGGNKPAGNQPGGNKPADNQPDRNHNGSYQTGNHAGGSHSGPVNNNIILNLPKNDNHHIDNGGENLNYNEQGVPRNGAKPITPVPQARSFMSDDNDSNNPPIYDAHVSVDVDPANQRFLDPPFQHFDPLTDSIPFQPPPSNEKGPKRSTGKEDLNNPL